MKTKLILTLMFAFLMDGSIFAQTNSQVLEEGGTGPYKAVMYEAEGFAEHTIFAQKDLSPFSAKKPLPVLVWGNGGCANSPRGHEKFLNDIASYGYIVLATGIMPKQDAPRGMGMGGGMGRGNQSRSEQQVESMDWAFAQNADKNSPYYQMIDTKNICISGMSCGGLQALFNCFDPRVTSIMICNSGLFDQVEDGGDNAAGARRPRMGGMPSVAKSKLKDIHCPIIYILGGETDIAYNNGMDDFKRIDHVPPLPSTCP